MMELNREERNELRLLLDKHFDDGELHDLCFELEIEYENLPGAAKKDRVRALVSYCERHVCLEELLAACHHLRPKADWPSELATKPKEATNPPKQSGSGVAISGEQVTIRGNVTGTSINYYGDSIVDKSATRQDSDSPAVGSGIPRQLYNQLHTVLLDCGSFGTDHELKAIFVDNRLYPWRNRLPQADNPTRRVEGAINFLHNQYNDVGENALVLLLRVLSEHLDSRDACHQRLLDLANELV